MLTKSVLIALRKSDSKTDIIPSYQVNYLPIIPFGDRSFHRGIFLPKLSPTVTDNKPHLYLYVNNLTHNPNFVKQNNKKYRI